MQFENSFIPFNDKIPGVGTMGCSLAEVNFKTIIMNFFDFYRAGGPFMNLISLMAILTLVITIWKVIDIVSKKIYSFKLIDLILLGGSVALATGILSQIVGIIQALHAIMEAGDVSPQLVMGGAIVSFYAPVYGFVVFIFSMIFYFILKEVIKAKIRQADVR